MANTKFKQYLLHCHYKALGLNHLEFSTEYEAMLSLCSKDSHCKQRSISASHLLFIPFYPGINLSTHPRKTEFFSKIYLSAKENNHSSLT